MKPIVADHVQVMSAIKYCQRLCAWVLFFAFSFFSGLAYSQEVPTAPIEAPAEILVPESWLASQLSAVRHLDTAALQELAAQQTHIELIDVRTLDEIARAGGMIKAGRRTHHINRGWLEFQIGERVPNLDTTLVVYCGTNRRSPPAANTLVQMGYKNVYNYSDGYPAWVDANLAVQSNDAYVGSMLSPQTAMQATIITCRLLSALKLY